MMRFDVYKRALLLTAASIALLSGPAFAVVGPTTISTKTTKPLKTSTSGDITIASGGVVSIPSSSTAGTTPAIELDAPSSKVTIAQGGEVDFLDTLDAVGIQADQGKAGEIISGGTINLAGTGSIKTGIEIGTTSGTAGTFTGLADTINNGGRKTAIFLDSTSNLAVVGDGSVGVRLTTGNRLNGDILIDGSIRASATSLTATSTNSAVAAVELDGTMIGDFSVLSSGTIAGIGASSQGVVVLGKLHGAILNEGQIAAIGTNTQSTTATGNPASGAALVIGNNVSGGIYNAGPAAGDTGTARAQISNTGTAPALLIVPSYGGITAAPINIGGYTDPTGGLPTASILNRGSITSSAPNENSSVSAITITGLSNTNRVTLTHGIVNSGIIHAGTTDNATSTAATVATAIDLASTSASGIGVDIVGGIVNANETGGSSGGGQITAAVSGASPGIAYGIFIGNNTRMPSLTNAGTISASATTTDATIANLSAFGIFDGSGTLTNINNSGTISAVTTTLDNFQNVSRALDLQDANAAITLTNSGNIDGEILLGGHGDTFTVGGTVATHATVFGNVNFGGGQDVFNVNAYSQVQGDMLEQVGGQVAVTIQGAGSLVVTNNGATTDGLALPSGTLANFEVSSLDVKGGGTLGLTLAQPFNTSSVNYVGAMVHATGAGSHINLDSGAILSMTFGSFVTASATTNGTAQFVVFDAPSGEIHIADTTTIAKDLTTGIPFLFNGSVCGFNVAGFTGALKCTGTNPQGGVGHSDVILNLTPKTAADLQLTGFAATMFAPANDALATDNALGAAVLSAGLSGGGKIDSIAHGNALYQKVYANFAPDVTGSSRAIAIMLTDQASGPVADRQRVLRMYAGQDGDMTLWGQEFGQHLSVSNKVAAGGYTNTGFGFVMGMDGGSRSSGRYGGALTFYSGDTNEKVPRLSKTNSEWYMLTGYSDWRGKGLFFDSQLSAGYGHLDGKRTISIDQVGGTVFTRTADGKRAAALLAGGATTGFIWNSGGTVVTPQISLDGLTMREEGYTEANGGTGMDLHLQPYYSSSLRAFTGVDFRQDLRFGDIFVQPEIRAGYRYDFLSGRAKLKGWFAGDSTLSVPVAPGNPFTIAGPDPAKGNLVAGGGFAVTTGAWSVGISYDYQRGIGGTGGTNQTGLLTLLGRI